MSNYFQVAKTFACILKKNGYTADIAQTSQEAIEKTDLRQYAIAIIDAEDQDSIPLLRKLAETRTFKIVITDFPDKAVLNGADACLKKVVKPQELLLVIKKLIEQSQ